MAVLGTGHGKEGASGRSSSVSGASIALLPLVLKRMAARPALTLALACGLVTAAALTSAIPIYTEGALRRVLVQDLRSLQERDGVFPGGCRGRVQLVSYYTESERRSLLSLLDETFAPGPVAAAVGLPLLAHAKNVSRDYVTVLADSPRVMQLEAFSDLGEHVSVLHGRLWSGGISDGTIEVLMSEEALEESGMYLGRAYRLAETTDGEGRPLTIRVVGTIAPKEARDPYWFRGFDSLAVSLIMDYDGFLELFAARGRTAEFTAQWYLAFDYQHLTLDGASRVLGLDDRLQRLLSGYPFTEHALPAATVLRDYQERRASLARMLGLLQVPFVFLLIVFCVLLAGLIAQTDGDEIAVLKSRGAGNRELLAAYGAEAALLCLCAAAVGPPIGLWGCAVVGASDGFLRFVQRKPLELGLSPRSFGAALLTSGAFAVAILWPAARASRGGIVQRKATSSRPRRKAWWSRLWIEAALLASSLYGLHRFAAARLTSIRAGVSPEQLPMDPLVYVASVAFILGAALALLRVLPPLGALLARVGGRLRSPALYAALAQTGREHTRQPMVMLFLVLVVATGLFSSSAARTALANAEERIRYETGADIVVREYWEYDPMPVSSARLGTGESEVLDISVQGLEPRLYREPPFLPITLLAGVEQATRVFRRDDGTARTLLSARIAPVTVMAIVPHEFGRVAWFRPELLAAHWYQYLNLLSGSPAGAVVSTSFRDLYGVRLGDTVWLSWSGQGYTPFTVCGFVDYWPAFSPKLGAKPRAVLMVVNLAYVQAKMALEPYEIWIKKRPEATSREIYDGIRRRPIAQLRDAEQELIASKRDPMLQGMIGQLTLAFIAMAVVGAVGFLAHWMASVRRRTFQLGVLRALGMRPGELLTMLVVEQAATFALSLIGGTVVGLVAAGLFLPVLEPGSVATLLPPYRVVTDPADAARLYAGLGVVFGLCVAGTVGPVRRVCSYAAVKLGEE